MLLVLLLSKAEYVSVLYSLLQDGATAFYHAARHGMHDVVKALIHKGVDIDRAVTNDGVSVAAAYCMRRTYLA